MRGQCYAAAHQRFVHLVGGLADDLGIPASPAWTVRDLVAHLTGVAADLVTGNVEGWAGPEWTAAQVSSRAGLARGDVLSEWASLVPRVVAVVDDPAGVGLGAAFGRMPLVDLTCHEADVREAAGSGPFLDSSDWEVLAEHRLWVLDAEVREAGLPALAVRTAEGDSWVAGGETAQATVRLPRYELWRSLMGRRTRTEVVHYDWSVDPGPYLAVWAASSFGWPEE
jgi:uncharacterized protein (TIGR03083 family)